MNYQPIEQRSLNDIIAEYCASPRTLQDLTIAIFKAEMTGRAHGTRENSENADTLCSELQKQEIDYLAQFIPPVQEPKDQF